MAENNGWNAWAKQVTSEIERTVKGVEGNHTDIVEVKQQLTKLQESVNIALEMKLDIIRLQVRAGIWGLLAGLTSAIITMLLFR